MTFTPTKELTAIMAENNISSSEFATWGTELEAYVNGLDSVIGAYSIAPTATATDNTNGFNSLEAALSGKDVDLLDAVYSVTSVPTGNHYYNGGFKVGSTVTWMPRVKKAHPLDGARELIDQPADFNFTGPLWYSATEARWHRVRMLGSTHEPFDGMVLTYEYSEDGGAIWKGGRSLHGNASGAISGVTGGPMGSGRFGILFAEVVSGTRTWYFTYSDDNGTTWSTPASIGVTAIFPYGPMCSYPTAAGGNDTTGFITYAYSGNQIYYVRTSDNGANWTSGVLFDGRSTGTASAGTSTTITVTPANVNADFYPDASLLTNVNITITSGTGSGQTRRISSANLTSGVITVQTAWSTTPDATSVWSIEGPTEVAVAQVNDETKWVIYARGASNFMAHTTTNMTSVSGAWSDTGIADRGQVAGTGIVGDSPIAFTKWGKIYLVIPRRENWTGDTVNENALMAWEQEASSLYDASGVFTHVTGRRWMALPDRPTSLPFFFDGPDGLRMFMRVGETTYDTAASQATRNYLLTIGMGLPPQLPCADFVNLLDNASFDIAERETSFTGITADQTPILDRWKLHCSGATFDASQVDVPENVSRMLPHRPAKALRLDSSGSPSDFSGIEQVHYGPSMLHALADRFCAFQIYGIGAPPAAIRAAIFFDYGTSGSADASETELFTKPVVSVGGIWWATAITPTPTLKGKSVDTSDCKVTIRIDNSSGSDAWDCDILGIGLQVGEQPTRMMPPDYDFELMKCLRYCRRFGANSGDVSTVFRKSTVQALGYVQYDMVQTPTVSFVGTASNLKINNLSATIDATGLAFGRVTDQSAEVQVSHASTTGYSVGMLYSTSATSYILVDAEA